MEEIETNDIDVVLKRVNDLVATTDLKVHFWKRKTTNFIRNAKELSHKIKAARLLYTTNPFGLGCLSEGEPNQTLSPAPFPKQTPTGKIVIFLAFLMRLV